MIRQLDNIERLTHEDRILMHQLRAYTTRAAENVIPRPRRTDKEIQRMCAEFRAEEKTVAPVAISRGKPRRRNLPRRYVPPLLRLPMAEQVRVIRDALDAHRGNRNRAARALAISTTVITKRIGTVNASTGAVRVWGNMTLGRTPTSPMPARPVLRFPIVGEVDGYEVRMQQNR